MIGKYYPFEKEVLAIDGHSNREIWFGCTKPLG
jgi:hypothetical protein